MEASSNDLRVKDLRTILDGLPDDMLIIIPVVDENDVNHIDGFRRARTVGILEDEYEDDRDRKVLCINGAADGADIADQVHFSGRDVSVTTVLYAYSKYDGPVIIAEHRSNYNQQVKEYNRYIRKFPTRTFLSMLGYEAVDFGYLEYDAPVDAPQDLFGE